MPNGDITFDQGVCTVGIDLNWLKTNGELPVCVAQPTLVIPYAIHQDESRPDSIALAQAILSDETGQPELFKWFNGEKGVLLFPEYAFGSTDFAAIHQMIQNYPTPLIVIAGFGAVRGNDLNELLRNCQPTWPQGRENIIEDNRYNAGWCWIHCATEDTKCYVFLKNFLEQRFEIAGLEGLTEGDHILKVETNDLVLYPLICADIICNQHDSPRNRIERSLPVTAGGQPDANKHILVAALLYTPEPYHDLWRPVINEIVSLHNQNTILCTVNQLASQLNAEAQRDKWRCLTGGFINKAVMPNAPTLPLPRVRYVSTDNASGLILRQPCTGVACGHFRWVNTADQGRNVWRPHVRLKFEIGGFEELGYCDEFHELKHYIQRRKTTICGRYHNSSSSFISAGLDQIIAETNENHLTPRLWTKLLTGVDESVSDLDIDSMDSVEDHLDRALAVFSTVQNITGANPLTGDSFRGQLQWHDNNEMLVWKSPKHDWRKMQQLLENSALKHPHEPQLIVLGGGYMGHDSPPKLIQQGRFTDFTTNKESKEFTQSRTRHIFWKPLGEIENKMIDTQTNQDQKRDEILQYLES
jgi:hypothetical protein